MCNRRFVLGMRGFSGTLCWCVEEEDSVDLQTFQGLHERLVIDTSEGQPSYLLIGRRGNYIKLSSSAFLLLRSVSGGMSFAALAERLSEQQARRVRTEDVEAAYQHVIQHITAIEQTAKRNPTGFWFRLVLMPAGLVERISRYLSFLFHPVVASLVLLGMLALIVLRHNDIMAPIFPADAGLVSVIVLFLISMVGHEFGHASACVRYGLKPSEIGCALYWIYPVFYSNVNAVWQLPRRQRVVVDIAGVYFQFIIGALYLLFYVFTGWEPAKIAIAVILYSCLFTLNPVLKFDGYWFVADLLGVVNLWKQPGRILQQLHARLRGRPVPPLPWSPWVTSAMVLYAFGSIGFWFYFTWVVGRVVWAISHNYPFVVVWAVTSALNPPHAFEPLVFLIFPTFTLLAACLTMLYVVRMLISLGKAGIRLPKQIMAREQASVSSTQQ